MGKDQTTTSGTSCPTLYDKCVGSFTSPADHIPLKMQETGPTVYRPYPRRIEYLTIGFADVIAKAAYSPRLSVGTRTRDLPHDSPALYQLS